MNFTNPPEGMNDQDRLEIQKGMPEPGSHLRFSTPLDTKVYRTESGASTSERPDYTQIPIHSLARIARIFEEGEVKHGRDNYKTGVWDEKFWRSRLSHGFQHLGLYMAGDRSVDHLAKVGWMAVALMELERMRELQEAEKRRTECIDAYVAGLKGVPLTPHGEKLAQLQQDKMNLEAQLPKRSY